MKILLNENNEKLFPICIWANNVDLIYDIVDGTIKKFINRDRTWDDVKEAFDLLHVFNKHVIGGIVYATWEDGSLLKKHICGEER